MNPDKSFRDRIVGLLEKRSQDRYRWQLTEEEEKRALKNKEIAPVAKRIVEVIIAAIQSDDTEVMKASLHALLSPNDKQTIIEHKHRSDEDFENAREILSQNEIDLERIYILLMSDSVYNSHERASEVTIWSLELEQIDQILEKLSEIDPEKRKNLLVSMLLVVTEELLHFMQFSQYDISRYKKEESPSPFLSDRMKNVYFDSGYDEGNMQQLEADVTFYLKEKGIDLEDLVWLDLHRKNYGNEEELFPLHQD